MSAVLVKLDIDIRPPFKMPVAAAISRWKEPGTFFYTYSSFYISKFELVNNRWEREFCFIFGLNIRCRWDLGPPIFVEEDCYPVEYPQVLLERTQYIPDEVTMKLCSSTTGPKLVTFTPRKCLVEQLSIFSDSIVGFLTVVGLRFSIYVDFYNFFWILERNAAAVVYLNGKCYNVPVSVKVIRNALNVANIGFCNFELIAAAIISKYFGTETAVPSYHNDLVKLYNKNLSSLFYNYEKLK